MRGEVIMKKTRFRLLSIVIAAVLMAAMFTACGAKKAADTGSNTAASAGNSTAADKDKNAAVSFPVTITDVYGSQVTIDKEPQRIVALAPSTVEVLYKLGLQDRIVGVTEYCNYPEEAATKPKV
jgi:iron complex transport system substrate-binding protein